MVNGMVKSRFHMHPYTISIALSGDCHPDTMLLPLQQRQASMLGKASYDCTVVDSTLDVDCMWSREDSDIRSHLAFSNPSATVCILLDKPPNMTANID